MPVPKVVRTIRILGDVEFAKDDNGFVSQVPAVSLVSWMFGMRDPKSRGDYRMED